jgi:ATP-dependent Lhr-like helicase
MFLAASRDAQATPSPSATDELDDIANDILKHLSQSTNLIFGNSKNSIELLASKLHALVQRQQWPVDPFGVHHASLSKDLREEAECSLKSGKPATVLCSSTMELGIDIGYVRAVGQLDPPASVASLVQRLGRSGRRLGEPAVLRLYVRLESPHPKSSLSNLLYPKLLQSIALVELLLARWLEPFDQERMHLSTLVHQILSCLKQTGGMRPINIYQTLCQNGPFRNVHQKQFATLLRELAKNDLIAQLSNGDLILSLRGERITASADFYAAFQSKEEYTVSWGNQEVGKLPADIIPPPGESLILAGRRWQVKEVIPEQQLVFVLPAPHGRAPLFAGEMGEIHSRVAQEMKTILLRDDEPVYLDPASKLLLRAARRVAHSAGLAERDFVIDNHTIQWFPWVGTRTLKTISLLAKSHNIPHITDHISIIYKTSSLELFRNHLQQIASKDINPLELARLLPVKAVDKFDCFLPSSLLDEANARDRLSLSEAREASAACLSCLS